MPLVELTLIEGRPPELLAEVMSELHRAVVEVLGAPDETVRVIVREVPPTHWSSGGTTVAQKRAAAPQKADKHG